MAVLCPLARSLVGDFIQRADVGIGHTEMPPLSQRPALIPSYWRDMGRVRRRARPRLPPVAGTLTD